MTTGQIRAELDRLNEERRRAEAGAVAAFDRVAEIFNEINSNPDMTADRRQQLNAELDALDDRLSYYKDRTLEIDARVQLLSAELLRRMLSEDPIGPVSPPAT